MGTAGEIWCPTLGGTYTFIGLYRALASYCLIVLLSYYPIIPLSNYINYIFSYSAKDNNSTPIVQ
jgi:hypothetical protein